MFNPSRVTIILLHTIGDSDRHFYYLLHQGDITQLQQTDNRFQQYLRNFLNPRYRPYHEILVIIGIVPPNDYQNFVIWTISWIKKILKILLKPMISLWGLRYISVMKEGIKMMVRVTNRVKQNEVNPRGIEHPILFGYH